VTVFWVCHAVIVTPYLRCAQVNIGNPREYTIAEFAQYITKLVGSKSKIVRKEASQDDPQRRRPDVTVAQRELQWAPQVDVEDVRDCGVGVFTAPS
jgi:UDP-glucuronate decarboxylase